MAQKATSLTAIEFQPLTPERWADFEVLFGPRGACAGCWCMWWRHSRKEYRAGQGEGNKRAMKALVDSGEVPGIVACAGGKPVGWCAIAPRETYAALARSRVLKPVDDKPVWSVTCFFIAKGYRKKGLSSKLLEAAAKFAASRGARIVEGYPREPRKDNEPEPFLYTGLASAFRKAGFKEVARRSDTRPIMRKSV
jgi:GNAT superfamily N-acetyltransferase